MKRIWAAVLALAIFLGGCAQQAKQYNATYLDLFDTVTTVIGSGKTEAEFRENARKIYEELLYYHQLFDIYREYEGIHNLKTVNDQAGIAPVTVDGAIISLLLDCREYYELTGGRVNAAMGSVLRLWHEARTLGIQDPANASLPAAEALSAAAVHTDFDSVVIDEAASTVFLSDPELSLDVGAIAKGWACQRAAENAPTGMLISLGGNVCATGPKTADGSPWTIGVQDPDDSGAFLQTLRITEGSVVTSGDYQRFYTVDGEAYHHIIDPHTQMPAAYWRSVTVVCGDSGLADALSTALFLLPLEEGRALAQRCGAQALWLDKAGMKYMTEGLEAMISS